MGWTDRHQGDFSKQDIVSDEEGHDGWFDLAAQTAASGMGNRLISKYSSSSPKLIRVIPNFSHDSR